MNEAVCNMYTVAKLTRVGLNTGGYFACSHIIKEGNILPQNGLEIALSKSLRRDLTSPYPNVLGKVSFVQTDIDRNKTAYHINEGANKHANT
jgi:hypothetical protein